MRSVIRLSKQYGNYGYSLQFTVFHDLLMYFFCMHVLIYFYIIFDPNSE